MIRLEKPEDDEVSCLQGKEEEPGDPHHRREHRPLDPGSILLGDTYAHAEPSTGPSTPMMSRIGSRAHEASARLRTLSQSQHQKVSVSGQGSRFSTMRVSFDEE